jgi:hypothetical protein
MSIDDAWTTICTPAYTRAHNGRESMCEREKTEREKTEREREREREREFIDWME